MPLLHHALYTNAFARRGRGFRHLFVAPAWGAADRRRLGRWLETLRPAAGVPAAGGPAPGAPGDTERVAVNGFRLGGTIHACLARIDAEFARDEHGRSGGVLAHALLVPLAKVRPAGHFGGALLAESRRFTRPETGDEERLEAYVGQCEGARELALPAVDPALGVALGEDFLTRFYAFSATPLCPGDAAFGPAASPLPDALADAAATLPPRLRLACRWAVGLRPTPEMSFVARVVLGDEALPEPPEGRGAVCAEQLLAPEHDGGRQIVEDLVEDWDIRSWDGLMKKIGRGRIHG